MQNRWLQHMCLSEDGYSDPAGIKVRPIKGHDGINYLEPGLYLVVATSLNFKGTITKNLSYVMGPLIDELFNFGYTKENLVAAPV